MTIISYFTSLDHTVVSLPFVASENAETMDEVFQGTEEQLERTYECSSFNNAPH